MSIEFTGTYICEKCKKEFEWNYFHLTRNRMSESAYICEEPPTYKTLAYLFEDKANGLVDVGVNCPYCGFDNQFTIPKKS